jgi:hypothetical protein
MADRSRDPQVVAHIEAISARAELDSARLVAVMFARCWPGGAGDRTEPEALQWVRRWSPARAGVLPPACSCKTGRCRICN